MCLWSRSACTVLRVSLVCLLVKNIQQWSNLFLMAHEAVGGLAAVLLHHPRAGVVARMERDLRTCTVRTSWLLHCRTGAIVTRRAWCQFHILAGIHFTWAVAARWVSGEFLIDAAFAQSAVGLG